MVSSVNCVNSHKNLHHVVQPFTISNKFFFLNGMAYRWSWSSFSVRVLIYCATKLMSHYILVFSLFGHLFWFWNRLSYFQWIFCFSWIIQNCIVIANDFSVFLFAVFSEQHRKNGSFASKIMLWRITTTVEKKWTDVAVLMAIL